MNPSTNITNNHGKAGLLWLVNQAERWHLADSELASLLGVTETTLKNWRAAVQSTDDQSPEFAESVIERMGLLLGLHKALVCLTPAGHQELADEWFKKPIHLWGLNGNSIRSHILDEPSTEKLIELVRQIRSGSA
ncbi:hypothetical protein [Marinobacter sp. S6332]|uniref:hypothetical protein n=1 Tax=Marinobacter sp. S6332 TaxID=2926403 RepID=UPI001FF1B3E2|nr:hypothetical protein [Marinobacter sp. S6332]MCK0162285.1 hypothetical protein [Marinobacter sp. S6332]